MMATKITDMFLARECARLVGNVLHSAIPFQSITCRRDIVTMNLLVEIGNHHFVIANPDYLEQISVDEALERLMTETVLPTLLPNGY